MTNVTLAAGMKDLGLYRVSGVLSEIQKLKKAFEKSQFSLDANTAFRSLIQFLL